MVSAADKFPCQRDSEAVESSNRSYPRLPEVDAVAELLQSALIASYPGLSSQTPRSQIRSDIESEAVGAGDMFPVAGVLVFLLYLLLLHEILTIVFLKYGDPAKRGASKGRTLLTKSCTDCQAKRTTKTLDALWRRMRKAKEYFRAVSSQRDQVTKHMAETKMEARELLRRRILEKRSRLLNMRHWDAAVSDSRED